MSIARQIAVGLAVCMALGAPLSALNPTLPSDRYIRRDWDIRTGLPQNSVVSLAQTPDGYLWIATFGGLVRFNGTRFEVFTPARDPMLTTLRMATVLVDRSGTLWAGMEKGGLARLVGGRFERVTAPGWTGRESVYHLHEGRSGALYAGTDAGLFRLGKGGRRWTTADGLCHDTVLSVIEDAEGTVWAGTRGGLNRIGPEGVRTIRPADGKMLAFSAIVERRDGSLCLGSSRGLFTVRDGALLDLGWAVDGTIGALWEDPAGTLWIAADGGGLIRIPAGGRPPEPVVHGVRACAILGDREGTLWAGTDGSGLVQLVDPIVGSWGGPGSPLDIPVRAVLADGARGVWAATWGKGLAHLTPSGVDFPWANSPLADSLTESLWLDDGGTLWVGTVDRGLVRHRGAGLAPSIAPALRDGRRQILVIARGAPGRLWLGTDNGLWDTDPLTGACGLCPGTEGWSIPAILKRGEEWWLGTDRGVYILAPSGLRPLAPTPAHPLHDVRALYADGTGAVWIGTYGGGLHRWNQGTLHQFTPGEGLPDPTISFIAEDPGGRLWITGNMGIFCVEREQLAVVAERRLHSARVRHYTEESGMITRECNGGSQPAGAISPDGTLLVPTIRGVAFIPPRKRALPRHALPLAIEKVMVNDAEVPFSAGLILTAGPQRVEIRYAALSFAAPGGLRYGFMMEGRDLSWWDAGTRTAAYYPMLPAGDFVFRVRAEGDDGACGEAMLAVRHEREVNETPWFAALWVFAGVAAIGGVFWFRTATLRASRRRLASQVRERTDELERLHSLTAKINEAILPEEILDHIYQSFRDLVPFERLLFATIDDDGQRIRLLFVRDAGGAVVPADPASRDAGPVLDLCAGPQAILLTECATVPDALHPFPRHPQGCSSILVPLRTRHGFLGVLLLSRPGPNAFDAIHLGRVNRIAGHLSTILEKSRLYEEVLRLSELKERFFGMAAHDLRHPLGALVLYCSLLEMEEAGGLEATVKTHLPAMKNACASMGRLIDDLLDYQALEDGRTALHLQRRDPAALTREIQPDLAILARHRSMRLTVRLPDSAPPVLMDPMRIRQVLDNLISNAVKYSRPGSEIHLTLAEEEGAVRWSVADRGVGIAPEDRTRLFQPFVKGLHRSPSGEKSIGLGLALCKRIVEAHRGTIGFEARPDGGTTFTFTLPIPPPSP